ncbi:MAG: MFS transporter [Planctomycetales bacterium]|nr:MFS transporter [Planctomycetales bacterium]
MRQGKPRSQLRRDARLASANAALWAIGAGLAPTLLVTFLAMDYRAEGLLISWIIAAPRFAGVLRLVVPSLINRLGASKLACVGAYALSSSALVLLPLLSAPLGGATHAQQLAALTTCWGLYQVLEYFGTTALWAWLGELFPKPVRGRLVGQRERWLVSGQLAGMALSFGLTLGWSSFLPADSRWLPMAASAGLGGFFMLAAVGPLLFMRDPGRRQSEAPATSWVAMGEALRRRPFRSLVLWSMALSVANGISSASRNFYLRAALGLEYGHVLPMQAAMRTGQWLIAPVAGRWVDLKGGQRVLLCSQAVVATSPLFFLAATRETPWWLFGAFLAWIAFGAMNVSLDTLKLNLSPGANYAPALAVYHAASDLASGLTLLAGGLLLGRIMEHGAEQGANYAPVLLLGFTLRVLVAAMVLALPSDQGSQAAT